jgi:flagellar biosynthesis/type III secretory pathway protein FliH
MIRRLSEPAIAAVSSRRLVVPGSDAASTQPPTDSAAYGDGYREGFEAGEADGLREAEARAHALEDELRRKYEDAELSLRDERDRLASFVGRLAEAEAARMSAMEAVAFEVALQCLASAFGEREGDRELLGRTIEQLVRAFRSDALRIEVAEPDRALLPDHVEGIGIEVRPGLRRGECALVTGQGRLETSIIERLSLIHRCMIQALGGEAP